MLGRGKVAVRCGLLGVSGAENDGLFSRADPGRLVLSGIHRHLPTFVGQGFADGVEGVARHIEEGDWPGQQVLHPGIELGCAPRAEVQQGKEFLGGADKFLHRPGVQTKRLGEAGIPATTGVVDEALFGRLAEVDLQGVVAEGEFGVVYRGLDVREGEVGALRFEFSQHVEEHVRLASTGAAWAAQR